MKQYKILIEKNCFFSDFSLQSHLDKLSLPNKNDLTKMMAAKLLEELGLGHLLQDTQCQRSSSIYSPSIKGWKNGNNHNLMLACLV
jgi:hypothetical protein